MTDRIAIEDVRVRYPAAQTNALDGVTLSVEPATRVGVAGRTGAGKSTLALLAAGFIPRVVRAKVEGRATVGETDLAKSESRDLLGRIGIVFATPANQLSASKLTVREELAFGLENLAVPRSEMDGRIDAVLSRLGIAHLADREPFALSGGEQQRVAIASIVAMGTDVLVLDEPTAQLDPAGSEAIADLLAELARDGAAVLCTEHDAAVLRTMDRVAVLDGGHLAALDIAGRALGTAALPDGLQPPTLVRLAEAAGANPTRAFDEAYVASALAAHTGPLSGPDPGATELPPSLSWSPVRDRARRGSVQLPRRRRGAAHRVAANRSRRDSRDRGPERFGQDDARETAQRLAASDWRSCAARRRGYRDRAVEPPRRPGRFRVPGPGRPAF
jgi:energy-coupling factor transport system ATP-binding protein